jgi:hypothetical protein
MYPTTLTNTVTNSQLNSNSSTATTTSASNSCLHQSVALLVWFNMPSWME